jgi:UPF0042 nucleotide-binding protein
MRLIIVSGLSGAGKSIVLNTLEDSGFYCIDNLPMAMLPTLASEMARNSSVYSHVAVGIDVRNVSADLKKFDATINKIRNNNVDVELLYVEASDNALLKRYSETRRKHPLSSENITLADAIARERKLMSNISEMADLHIDTTQTNVHQLRDTILNRISKDKEKEKISILFQSFGYKYGIPTDADFIFDVRCLPNPYWEPELRNLTGHDGEVINFLKQHDSVNKMIEYIREFMARWLPEFKTNNRRYLTIAIGCTGGQHRSVYIATILSDYFRKIYNNVQTRHRDIQ